MTVFTDHTDGTDELAARLDGHDALVLIRERTAIRAALLERLPGLALISQRSAFPHIDIGACTRLGIVVSSNLHADTPSYATAELTWALILAAQRRIPEQATDLRAGRWQTAVGRTLRGRTLGLFGYGRTPGWWPATAGPSGWRVVVWAREASRDRARTDGLVVAESAADLFAPCDIVSLNLRLVEATRGIVTADLLAAMRADALLVNTSRSGLIEPGGPGNRVAGRSPGDGGRRCL